MKFVSARISAPQQVTYTADDGSETIRKGGSRAWRNNNPGNIQKGKFANAHGAIGGDSRFAIFPDEATGLAAIVSLLSGSGYRDLTLEQAINKYAPPNENNTKGYIDFVAGKTGLSKAVVLSTLTQDQLFSFAKAIQVIEGWTPGSEA